jgi:GntR family transcriptional regulator, transcriptional repressor for pyruvate dehydrogenase complex
MNAEHSTYTESTSDFSDDRERKVEIMLLSAIRESLEPIGAVTLSLELQGKLDISQATIGRKLKEFDTKGLTERIGYKGRALTQSGVEYLEDLMNSSVIHQQHQAFLQVLTEGDEHRLIQVLEARRALEKEIARLAAERVKDEDVVELKKIIASQKTAMDQGEPATFQNLKFHELLTRISGNDVMAHALYLVRNQSHLSLLLWNIRTAVDGIMLEDHRNIVAAIEARDPEKAESAMALHIDRIITDVRQYFAMHPESGTGAAEPVQGS